MDVDYDLEVDKIFVVDFYIFGGEKLFEILEVKYVD